MNECGAVWCLNGLLLVERVVIAWFEVTRCEFRDDGGGTKVMVVVAVSDEENVRLLFWGCCGQNNVVIGGQDCS